MFLRNRKGMEVVEKIMLALGVAMLVAATGARLYAATDTGAINAQNGLSTTALPVFGK